MSSTLLSDVTAVAWSDTQTLQVTVPVNHELQTVRLLFGIEQGSDLTCRQLVQSVTFVANDQVIQRLSSTSLWAHQVLFRPSLAPTQIDDQQWSLELPGTFDPFLITREPRWRDHEYVAQVGVHLGAGVSPATLQNVRLEITALSTTPLAEPRIDLTTSECVDVDARHCRGQFTFKTSTARGYVLRYLCFHFPDRVHVGSVTLDVGSHSWQQYPQQHAYNWFVFALAPDEQPVEGRCTVEYKALEANDRIRGQVQVVSLYQIN